MPQRMNPHLLSYQSGLTSVSQETKRQRTCLQNGQLGSHPLKSASVSKLNGPPGVRCAGGAFMSAEMTGAKPAQNRKDNTNAVTHDYSRISYALERGLSVIPENSSLYPVIAEARSQITEDSGGRENLSRVRLDL